MGRLEWRSMFVEDLMLPAFSVRGHLCGRSERPRACLFVVGCIPPDCALAIFGRRRASQHALSVEACMS